jgi:hypothetical protein
LRQRSRRCTGNDFGHLRVRREVDQRIDLGQRIGELRSRTSDEAPGDDEAFQAGRVLEFGEVEHLFDGLSTSGVDESTGIHQHDVGALGMLGDLVAPGLEQSAEALGVDGVLRAPQGDDRYA